MKPVRRWFQYSLRSFLILLTALAVWLGVVVNRAREQQEAVKAIEAAGGRCYYDWQVDHTPSGHWVDKATEEKPDGPLWLRELIGDDFFHEVKAVSCRPVEADILKAIPYLQRLRWLEVVVIPPLDVAPLRPPAVRTARVRVFGDRSKVALRLAFG